jgi:catechol 2,3-dioxygenase-like lactoylglutathione lyase family enzyme
MGNALTAGIHHLGLAVPDLESATSFFVEVLSWTVVGGNPAYPAVFVSDGATILTLWRVADPDSAVPFDRRSNVGLHHVALRVADVDTLKVVFERVSEHPGTSIEFTPCPIREGSATWHFICTIPGGLRVEFAAG